MDEPQISKGTTIMSIVAVKENVKYDDQFRKEGFNAKKRYI